MKTLREIQPMKNAPRIFAAPDLLHYDNFIIYFTGIYAGIYGMLYRISTHPFAMQGDLEGVPGYGNRGKRAIEGRW